MQVAVGVGVGSALVPLSGSGSELSPSARCSHSPTIARITTRTTATTVTTHLPRHTIRQRLIIRPHGAVGAPLTGTTTLVEDARIGAGVSAVAARLRAPDDLRRAGDAKDLDKTGHLIEQISVAILLSRFNQDDRSYKAGIELFKPAGVFKNTSRCEHRMAYPCKLRQNAAS